MKEGQGQRRPRGQASYLTGKEMEAQRGRCLVQGHSANCWQVILPF